MTGRIVGQAAAETPTPPVVVSLRDSYNPNRPEEYPGLLQLAKENPRLELQRWGGISLPGGGGRAPLLMSLAGGTAPVASGSTATKMTTAK